MFSVCAKKIITLLFLLFLPIHCFAEDSIDIKLKDLKLRAELQEKMLSQSQKEILTLRRDLSDLSERVKISSLREQELRSELKNIDSSIEEMNSQILINRGKISVLKQSFKDRVRAIYKMQKGSTVFDYFANSENVIQILKKRRFLTEIANSDKQLLIAVNDAVLALEEGVNKLDQLRIKRQETLATLTLLLTSLKRDQASQEELIARKEKRRETIRLALAELRKSANELEQSLTGLIARVKPRVDNFNLKLESLIFPVKGSLLHGFGKRKHQEFSDFVFSKGIEISTAKNEAVKAVAKGKVILARELPGYGMVLILDHGARIYSLYARIKNLLISSGDEINPGQKIAEVENDKNFYFELRKMGKAVDPSPFFIR